MIPIFGDLHPFLAEKEAIFMKTNVVIIFPTKQLYFIRSYLIAEISPFFRRKSFQNPYTYAHTYVGTMVLGCQAKMIL
jgi:hypothetical protein